MLGTFVVISCLVASTVGFPQGGFPPGFPPPPPRDLPPGFEAVLPAEIVAQLKAIHENDQMPPIEKHESIDKIMVSLPEDVLDRLPKPPGFEQLPQEVRDALKDINRDKSLTWRTRMDKIRELLSGLPEEVRRLLPPVGPPPPPGQGFPHRFPSHRG